MGAHKLGRKVEHHHEIYLHFEIVESNIVAWGLDEIRAPPDLSRGNI